MEKKFLMLKTGQLVFIHKFAKKGDIVHGFNLHSPNLRIKSYKLGHQVKKDEVITKDTIDKGLKPAGFYNLDKDNKHHSAEVTQVRYKTLMETVVGKVPAMAES